MKGPGIIACAMGLGIIFVHIQKMVAESFLRSLVKIIYEPFQK